MNDRRAAPLFKIGVVADTHIPDRAGGFHPELLPALRAAGVQVILHAGDVSTRPVLDRLREIAPVYVARGNRDWTLGREVKLVEHLELAGVSIALMHGHGGWLHYLIDKVAYIREGYRLERYLPLLRKAAEGARVIVFGHTHHKLNIWSDDQMFFNPGSANFGTRKGQNPSWGLISITSRGQVRGEIFSLRGFQLQKKVWVSKRKLRES